MADVAESRVCADCQTAFVFSEQERAFFAAKALAVPRRCRACRKARRAHQTKAHGFEPEARSGTFARQRGSRTAFDITCTSCGRPSTVPFAPAPGRPVFCGPCHNDRRGAERRATEGVDARADSEDIVK